MKHCLSYVIAACMLSIFPVSSLAAPPNILFIAIDDFNDWSGYLKGHPQARTPNLDSLAKKAVVFTQGYCNSPACNPSRVALMSGKHPNSTGFYSNESGDFRKLYPKAVTLSQYFKANGYNTYRTGKIFHLWGDWVTVNGSDVDLSFEKYSWGDQKIDPGTAWPLCGINLINKYCDWGSFNQPYPDFGEYSRASITIQYLNEPHPKPFFIACGFYLPHLPWYFPKSILDEPGLTHIKNVNDVQLPVLLADDLNDLSQTAKDLAHSADSKPKNLSGTVTYSSWHEAITANGKWKEAMQAYLASIYFVDMQLGRVLTALQNSQYKDNTIVILWSDHGWLLGQKEAWSKYKPWQESVRSNFLIKAPGIAPAVVSRPVSFVDIYPTLIDLTGIPMKKDLDGRVLTPLLKNPTIAWDFPVVTAHINSNVGGWETVRNERYSYIRYMRNNEEELYDRSTDPYEWYNLAGNTALASVKKQLRSYTPDTLTKLGSWYPATTAVRERKANRNPISHSGVFQFSPQELRFSIVDAQKATLALYDLKGKMVRDFTKTVRSMSNGENSISLGERRYKPGAYVVRFGDGKNAEIKASIIR